MENDHITRQIQIDADPQRVWDALSDPADFGAWFRVKLDGAFVVGETTTGKMTYPGHEGVIWTSVTEVMEPPKRLIFRWPDIKQGEDVGPDTIWMTVSFTLQPQHGGTLVIVSETGFAALPKEQGASLLRDNAEGWEIQTANLKRYVES